MNTQTLTQKFEELAKGCKNCKLIDTSDGKKLHLGDGKIKLKLCPTCKAKLQTFISVCEDELEFLEDIGKDYCEAESDITDGLGFCEEDENYCANRLYNKINSRIKEFQNIIKKGKEILG